MQGNDIPTRADVARLAGVSAGTVSNVINGKELVSPRLVKRVENAIKQLGYVQNITAKSLASNNNRHIALLIYELSNPYFFEIYEGMESYATKHGYLVSIFSMSDNYEQKLKAICERNFSGIVSFMSNYYFESYLNVLQKQKIVTVNFDLPDSIRVLVDYGEAIDAYFQKLKEDGRTYVAYIYNSVREKFFEIDRRGAAFIECCEKYGFELKDKYMKFSSNLDDFSHVVGYNMAKKIIEESPEVSAIFCVNDLCALGAIKAIKEANLRVPEDIAIIGCDNMLFSELSSPMLSTMTFDKLKLGKDIVKNILKRIDSKNKSCVDDNIIIKAQPVFRETV